MTLFVPAIRLMNRLRYPQKFLLVGLLLLLPLLLVMYEYIGAVNNVIDFASKEQLGLVYNAPVIKFLDDIQQHRGIASAYLSGDQSFKAQLSAKEADIEADIAAVDTVDARLGATLNETVSWKRIKSRWQNIKLQSQSTQMKAIDSFNAHTALNGDVLVFITEIGNNSNLILDPNIDSYYFMDSVITKLPAMAEYMAQLRGYGLMATASKTLSPEDQTRFNIYAGLARSTLNSSVRSYGYAFTVNDSLQNRMQGDIKTYADQVNSFLDNINRTFITTLDNVPTTDSNSFFDLATQSINGVFKLYGTTSDALNGLLSTRIDRNVVQRNVVLIFALFVLALVIYLFIAFYLAVRQAINSLDVATQRMIGGHTEQAFVLDSQDELAQVAISFNNIARELLGARDQALESNRAKSVFLANMSHELRTPLNAVIGYSELIQEECEDSGQTEYVPDLKKIQAAAKHLLSLINDILDLSKIEAGKMDIYLEVIDVPKMLNEIETTVLPLIQKNENTLDIQCEPDLGMMRADLTKVRQVLFNLLSNASKFTQKGVVVLTAARETIGAVDWMIFTVKDSGIGMTQEQMSKLFKDFSQADSSTTRKYGGTGLGLSISKRFCQMLGGDIFVDSEPNVGSTFTVRLPVAVPNPAEVQADGKGLVIPAGANTVLVIDDDSIVREVLTRFLLKEGYYVETANSGKEGLQRAHELHPDVITLDVMMPGMDGWAVLAKLKADPALANIPVIMLSMVGDKNMGFALGASEYMTKPVDKERLLAILQKYHCEKAICKVLIVEDDLALREMVRRVLEKEGVQVIEAEDGRVGLQKVINNAPDLILLDLMMPQMNGFEFIEAMRKTPQGRTTPIVVVTAMELNNEERARLNGQVQSIVKKGTQTGDALFTELRTLVSGYTSDKSKANKSKEAAK